jgi:ubiquinone/menaquinone biosynthesis C-methylase UbiE
MAEVRQVFDDSAGYERFMGRWSRAVGEIFLDWIGAGPNLNWLDVGCGTGIFSELILKHSAPASVIGVDPSQAQIDTASARLASDRASFRVADAQALPFADAAFDVAAAALVVNFVPDRLKAVTEMRRVVRPQGFVAGYVWDFADNASPSGPLREGMRQIGVDAPEVPGTSASTEASLQSLLADAGLQQIAIRPITVTSSYADFDDFLLSQTPSYNPIAKTIAGLDAQTRAKLISAIRGELGVVDGGVVSYPARANAFMARVKG